MSSQKTTLPLELHEEIIDQLVRSLSVSPGISGLSSLKAYQEIRAESLGTLMPADVHAKTLSLRRDLSNCSLVCRAWLTRTRFHLFSTIQILTKPTPFSPCTRLISLLNHPSATLESVVRVLHLASLADCQVVRLLQLLPALLEVRLIDMEISPPCVSSLSIPFFPSPNSITALTLSVCSLSSLSVFFATVNQCPRLEVLVLDRVELLSTVVPRERTFSSPLKVSTLRVDDIPLELWQWLHVLCPTLHTVSTGPTYRGKPILNDLRALLSRVGASVEHICIPSIGGRILHDSTAEYIASFGLQYLVNLRSIRFLVFFAGGFGRSLHHLPEMLAQLPCGVWEVVLVLERALYTDMDAAADWNVVEKVLEGKMFRKMERFVFLLDRDCEEWKRDLEKWAKNTLKKSYERGVVHVEVD